MFFYICFSNILKGLFCFLFKVKTKIDRVVLKSFTLYYKCEKKKKKLFSAGKLRGTPKWERGGQVAGEGESRTGEREKELGTEIKRNRVVGLYPMKFKELVKKKHTTLECRQNKKKRKKKCSFFMKPKPHKKTKKNTN